MEGLEKGCQHCLKVEFVDTDTTPRAILVSVEGRVVAAKKLGSTDHDLDALSFFACFLNIEGWRVVSVVPAGSSSARGTQRFLVIVEDI